LLLVLGLCAYLRIPLSFTELSEAQEEEAMKLIEFLEEDEDVQNVFHNLA